MSETNKFYGKYRALVVSNNDPNKSGRIQVRCPKVLGEYVSSWCYPCLPFAFTDGGFITIPKNGDYVWVEFEDGDPAYPIWVGSCWQPNRTPLQSNYNPDDRIVFVSRNQHLIEIDDKNNTIIVKMKDGTRFKLGNGIEITAPTGTKTVFYGDVEMKNTLKVLGDIYEGTQKLTDKYARK